MSNFRKLPMHAKGAGQSKEDVGPGIGIADFDRHLSLVQFVLCLKAPVLMYNYYRDNLNTY